MVYATVKLYHVIRIILCFMKSN